tara:strand:- start:9598 stop:10419 length:822 start_codon:yes stop_codon:yes gene_type:complete
MKTKGYSSENSIIKWVGGKRWLTKTIAELLPHDFRTYYEPFLGGGALFFNICPKKAVLSDINKDLINAYIQVNKNCERIVRALKRKKISEEYYYRIRNVKYKDDFRKAAQFLYLTKTSFNGIYRVNKKGEFNVPFGFKYCTPLCDRENFFKASKKLKNAALLSVDFDEALKGAKKRDLVYLDPPYTVKHDNNGFRKYNESIFTWEDQLRLANTAKRLNKIGAYVFISNAHHDEILKLYGGFKKITLSRHSVLSANANYRTPVKEILMVSKNCL